MTALAPPAGLPLPTDLRPVADRPGTTWRWYVVDHNTLILRARMEHGAAPLIGVAA